MEQVTAKDLSDVLVVFLERFLYNDTIRLSPDDLQSTYEFTLSILPNEDKIVRSLSEYVHCTFPFLSLDIRKAVAVYDSFQMSVNDIDSEEHDSLQDLCIQLSSQQTIQHPVWKDFYAAFSPLLKFYGPYAQTTLFRGALEFIQATCLERTLFRGYPGSTYPDYVRRMSAQGPVQAAVCFPEIEFPQCQYLPVIASLEAELEYFVGTVNDVFSFYKESDSAFERTNYPLNKSACSGRGVLQILYELVDISICCRDRVQKILIHQNDNRLFERVDQFFTGYIRYHLACDRYKISSLCAESGNRQLQRFYDMSLRAVGQVPKCDIVESKTKTCGFIYAAASTGRERCESRQETGLQSTGHKLSAGACLRAKVRMLVRQLGYKDKLKKHQDLQPATELGRLRVLSGVWLRESITLADVLASPHKDLEIEILCLENLEQDTIRSWVCLFSDIQQGSAKHHHVIREGI